MLFFYDRKAGFGASVGIYAAVCAVLFVAFLFAARPASAATCTYAYTTGAAANSYNTVGNWSCGRVPTYGDDVVIPTATSTALSASPSGPIVKSITIQGTGSLTLAAGVTLGSTSTIDITGTFAVGPGSSSSSAITVNSGGTLSISTGNVTGTSSITNSAGGTVVFTSAGVLGVEGDFTNAGTFTAGSSTFQLANSATQTINGAAFNKFTSIKTAGTASITSSSTVSGAYTSLGGGTINVGSAGGFTLLSSMSVGTSTTFTVGAGTSTVATTIFNAGTFTLTSGTATSTGKLTNAVDGTLNGGTGLLVLNYLFTNDGTFTPQTGTVRYASSTATNVTPTTYYSLEFTGGTTFTLTATTTAGGTTTVRSGNTLAVGAVTYTGTGAFTNEGTITETTGTIKHAAEAASFTDSSFATASSYTAPDTIYLSVQDSNRNLNGSTAETMTVTVSTDASAGSDSETVTLTETTASSGIFRGSIGLSKSNSVTTGSGGIESAAGSATLAYADNQDSTDSRSGSVTISVTASSNNGGGGGVGGGTVSPVTTYQVHQNTGLTATQKAQQLANLQSIGVAVHSLVRTVTDSAVYYIGADGGRHAFPNDKIYFTWYPTFSGVTLISAEHLASIPLSANVHYKPGVRMVKFTTDPKTYAVGLGGELRWIQNQDLATALYGTDWNKKIDDLSDAFYANYAFGSNVTKAADFSPSSEASSASTISTDLSL